MALKDKELALKVCCASCIYGAGSTCAHPNRELRRDRCLRKMKGWEYTYFSKGMDFDDVYFVETSHSKIEARKVYPYEYGLFKPNTYFFPVRYSDVFLTVEEMMI